MHRLPYHENQHALCNLYCHGDVHVDVLYLAPWAIEQAGADLLGYVREAWQRHGYDRTSTVLTLTEAPEAKTAHEHYPQSYQREPHSTIPYRVTYRILNPQAL
jgi:hypothetical protein